MLTNETTIRTRTWTRRTALALAATLATCTAALAAAPLQGLEFGRRWWKNPEIAERLHLSADQIDGIDRVAYEAAEKMIDLRAQRQKAEMALLRVLDQPVIDDQELDRAVQQLEQVECRLRQLELEARVDVARLLDREQRELIRRRLERTRQARDHQPREGRRPR